MYHTLQNKKKQVRWSELGKVSEIMNKMYIAFV